MKDRHRRRHRARRRLSDDRRTNLTIAELYDMLPASSEGNAAGCTPADNATVRPVFMIGPDKRVKLILTHPMTTGRNFNEIRLAAKHQVVTPANWRNGEGVILTAAVSDAETRFGGFTRVLPYLRTTPQPEG